MTHQQNQNHFITQEKISLRDFMYRDDFIRCPAFQGNDTWSVSRQQNFIDSLIRRYYVPNLFLRIIMLSWGKTAFEIIDGQQRITAIQDFFDDKYELPESLNDVNPYLPHKKFSDLSTGIKKFIGKELYLRADVVKNLEDPDNPDQQRVTSDLFSRLSSDYIEPSDFKILNSDSLLQRITSIMLNRDLFRYNEYDLKCEIQRLMSENEHLPLIPKFRNLNLHIESLYILFYLSFRFIRGIEILILDDVLNMIFPAFFDIMQQRKSFLSGQHQLLKDDLVVLTDCNTRNNCKISLSKKTIDKLL